MKRHWSVLGVSLLTTVSPVACSDSEGPRELCFATFVADLRATGAAVEILGDVSEPFFSVPGRFITVNDEDVQVFEYASSDSRAADAMRISPDATGELAVSGAISSASWLATRHVYHGGRLIVVYAGTTAAVHGVLAAVLGGR